MTWLLVLVGGGLGALARHEVTTRARLRGATTAGATMLVNLPGSLLLGLVAGIVTSGGPDWLLPLLGVGFCGGFTTFSTAMVEAVRLLQDGDVRRAWGSVALTLVLSVAAASVGVAVTSDLT